MAIRRPDFEGNWASPDLWAARACDCPWLPGRAFGDSCSRAPARAQPLDADRLAAPGRDPASYFEIVSSMPPAALQSARLGTAASQRPRDGARRKIRDGAERPLPDRAAAGCAEPLPRRPARPAGRDFGRCGEWSLTAVTAGVKPATSSRRIELPTSRSIAASWLPSSGATREIASPS